MVDKEDNIRTFYELRIVESEGGYDYVIDMYHTDYIMEAMDIRDRWVKRGNDVYVTKITHEKVNL
jgi:hypothetical protein